MEYSSLARSFPSLRMTRDEKLLLQSLTPYLRYPSVAGNCRTNQAATSPRRHLQPRDSYPGELQLQFFVVPSKKRQSGSDLERAVQRNHSVGCAAIFVEADVGAIEVEVSIWLIAGLRIDG